MPVREYLPWVSGKKRSKKKRKTLPPLGGRHATGVGVLMGIASASFLIVGLATETLLWVMVAGLSAVATGAQITAIKTQERMEQRKTNAPPKPPRVVVRKPETQQQSTAGATPGVIKCSDTGVNIAECTCASRHVRTQEGVKTYGGPIGRPIGKKPKGGRVPMTTRAKHG